MPNNTIDLYKEIVENFNSGVLYVIPLEEGDSIVDFELTVANKSAKEILQIKNDTKYISDVIKQVLKDISLTQFVYVYNSDSILQKEVAFKLNSESVNLNLIAYRLLEGVLIMFYDISKYKQLEEKLSHSAYHDKLTSLPNRLLFQERLFRAFVHSQRNKQKVIVLFIDLDGFKDVNDTLGHDYGDSLLVEVSNKLLKCARDTDTVARLGGDEFTIVMENTRHETDATIMAQRILTSLKQPIKLDSHTVFITGSIGIAVGDPDQVNPKLLMKQADMALYLAKAEGKTTFRYYTPSLNVAAQRKMYFMNATHEGIKNNEFEIYYQPISTINSNNLISTEALLRWNHPELGYIPPRDFLPILEETGEICSIGMWVIDNACKQLKKLKEENKEIKHHRMSINLSPNQLLKQNIFYQLKEILQNNDLEPDELIFEITEKTLIIDNAKVKKTIFDLKDFGVNLALDDFGTGFSALNHIKEFPINYIKIDRDFTLNLKDSQKDVAVIDAIVRLAHSLGVDVIAEGVEDGDMLSILQDLNCDYYQGYHLQPPLSSSEYGKYYSNHH